LGDLKAEDLSTVADKHQGKETASSEENKCLKNMETVQTMFEEWKAT
jgi:hypothetical protein